MYLCNSRHINGARKPLQLHALKSNCAHRGQHLELLARILQNWDRFIVFTTLKVVNWYQILKWWNFKLSQSSRVQARTIGKTCEVLCCLCVCFPKFIMLLCRIYGELQISPFGLAIWGNEWWFLGGCIHFAISCRAWAIEHEPYTLQNPSIAPNALTSRILTQIAQNPH